MKSFVKPTVVVSKCLEFGACRYNGDKLQDHTIQKLKPYVEFIPVCPEIEIGLGVPRETIRIVEKDGKKSLVQPTTKENLTKKMSDFTSEFLQKISNMDGFILKNRSPTCGIKEVKVYGKIEKSPVIGKSSGFFGGEVMEQYSHLAVEEEGRLKNFTIREHFFMKLFTLASFRKIKNSNKAMKRLIEFHSANKYLFMAYNQTQLKELGRIVANHHHRPIDEVFVLYEHHLFHLLEKAPRTTQHINVCQHIMGYFKQQLTDKEKEHFLSLLEKYKDKKIPLNSIIQLLKSWVYRFENEYLLQQTYFEPYPEELMEITDSGKGRDY